MSKKRYIIEIEVDESKLPFNGELWSRSEPDTDEVFEVGVISAQPKITAAYPAGRPIVGYRPRSSERREH